MSTKTALILVFLFALFLTSNAGWSFIDYVDDNAAEPSLIVDSSGDYWVAYQKGDGTHSWLKLAHYDGTWHKSDVTSTSGTSGACPSLVLDSNGYPHIAYYDYYNGSWRVNYTYWNGSSWTTETVQAVPYALVYSWRISLKLTGSDSPRIAFSNQSYSNYVVNYAYKSGGSWTIEQVSYGDFPALTLDSSNNPYVAYRDGGDNAVFAYKSGGTWVWEYIENSQCCGSYMAMDMNSSDEPCVAYKYYHNYYPSVKYGNKHNGSWHLGIVETSTDKPGDYVSIVIGGSDIPHIAHQYYNPYHGDRTLRYDTFVNGSWDCQDVDDGHDDSGYWTSIGQYANDPVIAYSYIENDVSHLAIAYDNVKNDLKENKTQMRTSFSISGVHPSPTSSMLSYTLSCAKSTDVTVSVYDLSGRVVATQRNNIIGNKDNQATIDVSSLATGVYFIKASTATGEIATTRFVVSR
jgi:hypothetical protein